MRLLIRLRVREEEKTTPDTGSIRTVYLCCELQPH